MRRKLLSLLVSMTLAAVPLTVCAGKVEAATNQKVANKSGAVKKQAKKQVKKQLASSTKKSVPVKKFVKSTSKSKKQVAEVAHKPLHRVSLDDDPGRLAIQSSAAVVIDQTTGKVLVEKHSDAVVPIASITKLMTAMVVLDASLDLHEVIAISAEDIDDLKGSRSRLPVGATMTRETAMLLALMSSENRAANALGRHYPGGLRAFVQAMNRKAKSLGMHDSHFEEPTGLSSNNVSTAHDLARMVAAAARYPEIRNYSTTAEAKLELNGRIQNFNNTNALVRSDNWQIGLSKTGYISEAGRCLVMQAWVADKPVVIVLLDSQGKMTRVGDANRIKRWMESASLTSTVKPT
ncbi:D-alanyl-D-alanine endopeptidase [Azonexus sp.]|uniref:D-alanyl-D-alanine endopeptidase n=1 Tax=Azonexus sp. TaxID=1872668 RepID=UPI0027BA8F86|nr:D-alanyl-D-alanine endopeptidase [Azonexus sp.]